jgi:drug/metabolite transporter (DMT)-like permease
MTGDAPAWLWIPITIFAALAQTFRNAAQRHLTKELGTLGATLVRFLYGLPFAVLWLLVLHVGARLSMPAPNWAFFAWTFIGAVGQLVATALLLRTMEERNFAIGVVYSKTEIVQIALFAIVLLGDPLSLATVIAILLATIGLVLLAPSPIPADGEPPARLWTSRAALFGLGSGAAFAISAVGYRGGALALESGSLFIAAAFVLVWAQTIQTLLLGGWLLARSAAVIPAVLRAWRLSLAAGFFGAAGSAGWFTAMALEPVANVRTVGLVEVLFSLAVSRRVFKERTGWRELAGIALVALAVAIIAQAG